MKALSVRAPWAGMIARGEKDLEVRSWRTRYRGELLICESRGGGAVALVELVGVREGRPEDVSRTGGIDPTGSFVWELRLLHRARSPRVKGRLGFFDVDRSVFEILPGPIPDSDRREHDPAGALRLLDVRLPTRGEVGQAVRLRAALGR